MAQAVIGCKLPNGIKLNIGGEVIHVPGRNASQLKDAGGRGLSDGQVTIRDGEAAKAWFDKHENTFKPIRSGALYLASSESDAKNKAKQAEGKKTGLEPVDQSKPEEKVTKA